ncbi:hypothetical protein BDW42DRAFT_17640 [Aspergillus taichungensis]|uniref:NACHT and WD domain protein n=1 Tax=Aspergillus taichungensis TaxID=482145 RepID=A0A2J5I555_9EURO|nr:hypothetical protein BDW42DRAFT_17640 [Aspergillus taichungensis]
MKSQGDCFNILHFAKSLLSALSTSPCLHDAETPIIFIGHSMGGLVIKKAYLLACHDPVYGKLTTRFRAIFFFATPHRGSDSAKVLHNILRIAYTSRAYVSDLKRGSKALQSINEDFRKYSDKMELCSFYETQKLAIGPFGTLIVDPDSATLGCREEQQIPLHADHRSICKFETPTDPNYIVIRNVLASTVQKLCKSVFDTKEGVLHSQMKEIGAYLEVYENLEDDLILVDDARMPGTCEWLKSKVSFKRWSDFNAAGPSILWVNGKPATGKTVLAGYVVNRLREQNANCSFYFFKHGDNSKSQLGGCLRSLAFQMARADPHIRQTLLRMQKHDTRVGSNDERVLWRKLFLSGIFQAPTQKRYFWVIDALDECINITSFFETMLAKFDQTVPIRMLITGRETPEIGSCFHALGDHAFCSESITVADTLLDIKRLVDTKAKALRFDDYDGRANLVEKILEKSQGSFLWTILVMTELSNAHSEQEILQVLDDLPKDMELLYRRSLDLMSQETRGKKLSKAILVWTTCASRPLGTDELGRALELDIRDSFPKLRDSIMALCGQLVTIDKFDRVHIAHETVREFLLQEDLNSEFAISKTKAHTRIATACLEYLNGEEMNPPRPYRRVSARRKRSEFCTYACTYFSYHLSKVPPSETDMLVLVDKFLKSNILSWIEFIAQSKNLTPLIRTAKNLKIYLDTVAIEQSPLGGELQTIRGWITDLVRIATKFSQPLTTSPSSIYTFIPPFCPKTSTIYQAANLRQRLSVSGLSSDQWDDRLACVEFRQTQTTAVCYSEEFLAVGLASGTIAIYHASSCQEYRLLYHGEAVMHIQMKRTPELLAVGGLKSIRVWDVYSGQLLHVFASPQRTMSLIFDRNLLMAACTKNYIASWDLDNQGKRCPDRMWQNFDNASLPAQGTPCAISISIGHQMLAVAYSNRPVVIWDIQENAFYGDCGKKLDSGETSTHMVTALVFNPNPAIDRLVVSYLDGDLALVDPFQDQVLQSFRANCQTLATSADGRLMAGAVGFGTIQIYEFDTLTLLYRVQSSNYYIKQLAFSRDGLHLADVRGSQCNVWEPAVLLRGEIGDDSRENTITSVVKTISGDTKVKISAMAVHSSEEVVFCGKDD